MAMTQTESKTSGASTKTLKVTLVKSIFGHTKAHQATVRGLGLRKIRDTATLKDTPEVRGMLRASTHLLKVEEV
jgi:large subunit ribosomal protein L30